MGLRKFNEWTSWRDDLYEKPEEGDPDMEYRKELKRKEKKKKLTKKTNGVVVDENWEKREVEELTDNYHWTKQDLKYMKIKKPLK